MLFYILFVCLCACLFLYLCVCVCVCVCLCRSDCGGPCLSADDSILSSPVVGRHFRPRDLDVTGNAAGCHDDACCVAKSLLVHDDVMSTNTSTTDARCGSPQARLLYDSRPPVVAPSCNNIHAVVFSSKPDQHNPLPVTCDCIKVDDAADEPIWRLAQSPSRPGDDDVQYYVIDRRKLASAMRRTTSSVSKRTSPVPDDGKQLCFRGARTDANSGKTAGQSVAGECRPLLIVSPGECCRNQRYSPVPASVDNSNDSAS